MHIEYLTTALQIGGAEKVVFDLALGMAERGHDVSVTSLVAPSAYQRELEQNGVVVRSLGIERSRKDIGQVLTELRRYRRSLAARPPAILHSHMVHANLFGRAAVAFRKSSTRLICTIHNTYEGGRLRDLAYVVTNCFSDLDTTVSQAATRRFVSGRVLPKRTRTVPNGVSMPRYVSRSAPDLSARFRWLAVGRLEPQKDYPTLLAAMARIPGSTLTVAGDGGLRASLEAAVHELGLIGRVTFIGWREDMEEQYASHDGYVLSSAWEGFGLALAEAMAAGLPVVATRSGGPLEVVGDSGACGLLVPPGSPADLAIAMTAVEHLTHQARTQMGLNGRNRVAHMFGYEAMLDRWETIYTEVAGGG